MKPRDIGGVWSSQICSKGVRPQVKEVLGKDARNFDNWSLFQKLTLEMARFHYSFDLELPVTCIHIMFHMEWSSTLHSLEIGIRLRLKEEFPIMVKQ